MDRCQGVVCKDPPTCRKGSGTCNPATGACEYLVDVGAGCSGDLCMDGQTCQADGTCSGGAPKVCQTTETCRIAGGSCNPATGNCEYVVNMGTSCGDDPCMVGQTCQADGTCSPGTPRVCHTTDACRVAEGTCNSATGACQYDVALGATCGDDPCVVGRTCQADGTCGAGAPKVCQTTETCRIANGTCDQTTGTCVYAVDQGKACGGDPCLVAQTCRADGTCGGEPKCAAGLTCNPADGSCSAPPGAPGAVALQTSRPMGIALDAESGALFLAGVLDGNMATNFGNGHTLGPAQSAFVARLDPSDLAAGWATAFGEGRPYDQSMSSVAVAGTGAGKVVGALGIFSGSMTFGASTIENLSSIASPFLAAVEPAAGSGLWGKKISLGGSAGALTAIAGRPAERAFVVCGHANGVAAVDLLPPGTPVPTPGGGRDIVVAKVDAVSGAVIWGKQFSAAGDQYCNAVAIDGQGDVYLTGNYAGTVDFGSGALPTAPAAGAAYVAKLDGDDGATLGAWSYGVLSGARVASKAIAIDPDGDLIIGGQFSGTSVPFGTALTLTSARTSTGAATFDAFVAKLRGGSSPGEVLWARRWGGAGTEPGASALGVTSDGQVVVATNAPSGTTDFGPSDPQTATVTGAGSDVLVVRLLGSTGAVVLAQTYGDAQAQAADGVVVNRYASGAERDAIVVIGGFSGSLDFGGLIAPLTASSAIRFVVKMQ